MLQRPHEPLQRHRILLRLADHELRRHFGRGPRVLGIERPLRERGVAREPRGAITGRFHQQRPRGARLIGHDVADPPAPAGPEGGEIPRRCLRLVAAARAQPVERHVYRAREPRARRFGEDARPAVVQRILPRRRPLIVRRVGGHTGLPLLHHAPAHRHAERVRARREDRIDVGFERVHVGRDEDASGVAALLMHIVHDLRDPRRVEGVHRVARFLEAERVPVAIVVVPRVVVVQRWRVGPFGRRVERAAVPVAHDVHAIGVLAGHEHDDGVRENRLGFGRITAREPVGDHERREEAAHLGRVNARRDQNDVLSLRDEFVARALADARIPQLLLDLPVLRQIRERGFVGDERDEKRAAECRLAERAHADTRRGLVERGEVVGDLLPGGELAVGARLPAEDGGGSREGAAGARGAGRGRRLGVQDRGAQGARKRAGEEEAERRAHAMIYHPTGRSASGTARRTRPKRFASTRTRR